MNVGDRWEERPQGDRCVLWHPPGVKPDGDLLGALSRRGMRIVECDNNCEAFGHLCAMASGRGPPDPSAPVTVLLLSDPEQLRAVGDVVTLAQRYAPHAMCWTFDAHGERRLRAVGPDDIERWSKGRDEPAPSGASVISLARRIAPKPLASPARPPGEAGQSQAASIAAAIRGPRLRLAGEGTLPPAPEEPDEVGRLGPGSGESENKPAGAGMPLLSDQELSMLLAKDPLSGQD